MFFENRKPNSVWGYDEHYYKKTLKKSKTFQMILLRL
jgi:hypothetical protein